MSGITNQSGFLPSIQTVPSMEIAMPQQNFVHLCPLHKSEINMFCKVHQLVFCETCGKDHIMSTQDLELIQSQHHTLERIDFLVVEAQNRMQQQVNYFEDFRQKKGKFALHLLQSDFHTQDQNFEDAYKQMVEHLRIFKNLNNMEKVFVIKDLMPDFIHAQDRARMAMERISQFINEQVINHQDDEFNAKLQNGQQMKVDPLLPTISSVIPTLKQQNVISQVQLDISYPAQTMQIEPRKLAIEQKNMSGLSNLNQFDDFAGKGQLRKHWGINLKVKISESDEVLEFSLPKSTRIRNFKQMILSKINPEPPFSQQDSSLQRVKENGSIPLEGNPELQLLSTSSLEKKFEQMQLSIEGGQVFDKNNKTLEDYNVNEGEILVLEYLQTKKQSQTRIRKPKEILTVQYTINDDQNQTVNKVEIARNSKIRALKKLILQQLGMEKEYLKIFIRAEDKIQQKQENQQNEIEEEKKGQSQMKQKEVEEEKGQATEEQDQMMKEEIQSKKDKNYDFDGEDDNIVLSGLIEKDKNVIQVQVEVIIKVSIEVPGKGKDYCGIFNLHPQDPLEILKTKIPFFKTFIQRKYELFEKDKDVQFTDFSKRLIELGLRTGSCLVLLEPMRNQREELRKLDQSYQQQNLELAQRASSKQSVEENQNQMENKKEKEERGKKK